MKVAHNLVRPFWSAAEMNEPFDWAVVSQHHRVAKMLATLYTRIFIVHWAPPFCND